MSIPLPTTPFAFLGLTWSMALWGVALGGIPIVIHLLHKRKYRQTTWAAMKFLLEAARKHSRRMRMEQLLLLLLRVMILVFLVAALQGMYLTTTSARPLTRGSVHNILVIDASYSMQYEPTAGCPLFVRAKQAALRILNSSRPGDLFNLVLITDSSNRVIVQRPSRSKEELREIIRGKLDENQKKAAAERDRQNDCRTLRAAGMQPTEEPGRLLSTLTEVEKLVTQPKDVPKRVYFISDLQRQTWRPDSQTKQKDIHKAFETIGESATVVLIDVGVDEPQNVAVTSLVSKQQFTMTNRPARLQATVENFGSRQFDGKLTLLIDNAELDGRGLSLKPGERKNIDLEYPRRDAETGAAKDPPLGPGDHVFEVRLSDDALRLDNRRRIVIPVWKYINVLLVNGFATGRLRDDAAFFLQRAMRPSTSDEEWKGVVLPKTITASELLRTDLLKFDCVFLCSVPSLKESEVRKLQSYVESGGALIVTVGPNVDLGDYNTKLYRDGAGLLPAKLTKVIGPEYGTGRVHRLDVGQLNHPIVEKFRGNPGTGLENVETASYVRAELPNDSSARVVLRFQRVQGGVLGDPVMIESAGRGRVLLITTTVDPRWSYWCVNPSFPVLMNETVYHCVSDKWKRLTRRVGQPIERGFPLFQSTAPDRVPVTSPDGVTHAVPLAAKERWVVLRGGADTFDAPPTADAKPSGRIPAGAAVERIQKKEQSAQVRWQRKTAWVRSDRLRRLTTPLLVFENTSRSGVYEVKLRPPLGTQAAYYTINTDPSESDLRKVDEATLRKGVLSQVPFQYRSDWRNDVRMQQVARTHQSTPTRWFLIAVLCLLFVELLMAWRFFPGFVALLALAAFEATRWATYSGWVVAVIVGIIVFGLVAVIIFWRQHLVRDRSLAHRHRSGL